jgi:hypothetical protein
VEIDRDLTPQYKDRMMLWDARGYMFEGPCPRAASVPGGATAPARC